MDLRRIIRLTMKAQRMNALQLHQRIGGTVARSALYDYLAGKTETNTRAIEAILEVLGLTVVKSGSVVVGELVEKELDQRERQIDFCVTFWAARLEPKVTPQQLVKFERSLRRVLSSDPTLRSCGSQNGPAETLDLALKRARLNREPPLITDDVGMIFNPDGSVDVQEDKVWRRVIP